MATAKETINTMQLEIRERTTGDVTLLDLIGKITIGEGSVQLRDAVSRLLDAGRNRIILNLGGVTYVDSSGIGELVSRFTTTKNTGGKLKLLNLPKKIKDLLMITKLLTVFEIYEDEQSALESFQ
jgi:anti-sigma B factor antagonist